MEHSIKEQIEKALREYTIKITSSPEAAKEALEKSGIYQADGTLSPNYRLDNTKKETIVMKKRFMIDIETLGTEPGCQILAVGVAAFDETGIYDSLEFAVNDPFGKVNSKTLEWWKNPAQEDAKKYLAQIEKTVNASSIATELTNFYIKNHELGDKCEWWANSPQFDMSIIDTTSSREGDIHTPWVYSELRDVRTIRAYLGDNIDWNTDNLNAPLHSPLADCEMQVRHVLQFEEFMMTEYRY